MSRASIHLPWETSVAMGDVFRRATPLLEAFADDAQIHVHAVLRHREAASFAQGPPSVSSASPIESRIERTVQRALRGADLHKLHTTFECSVGSSASEILRSASSDEAGLIVVAASVRGAVARFLLGDTAFRVLREAACSVYVLSADRDDAHARQDNTILVGLDGSAASAFAMHEAFAYARRWGSRVHGMVAVEAPHAAAAEWLRMARVEAERRTVSFDGDVAIGSAARVLRAAVQRLRPRLLTLGDRGRGERGGPGWLGSTAYELARESFVDTLIVRNPQWAAPIALVPTAG